MALLEISDLVLPAIACPVWSRPSHLAQRLSQVTSTSQGCCLHGDICHKCRAGRNLNENRWALTEKWDVTGCPRAGKGQSHSSVSCSSLILCLADEEEGHSISSLCRTWQSSWLVWNWEKLLWHPNELKEFVNKPLSALESRLGASAESPNYPLFPAKVSVVVSSTQVCHMRLGVCSKREMRTRLHSCSPQGTTV